MTLIQDTLALWREAERVLDRLPPSSPEHETVAMLVLELQSMYTRLTAARGWSQAELTRSRSAIEAARDLLRRVGADRVPEAAEG